MNALVEPTRLTNYHRTDGELEALVIYAVMAWGREASRAQRAVSVLLDHCPPAVSPFKQIRLASAAGMLRAALEATRIGDYAKRQRALERAIAHDPRTVSVEVLSACVGLKSARLVALHSRRDASCAVLDRHVLAYLRDLGYAVPERDTPRNSHRYQAIEALVLAECARQGRHPAELDLTTWLERSQHPQTPLFA
jgi:hypothetical protein